eukprot:272350-Chlamydomonas_euryale.AAC.5
MAAPLPPPPPPVGTARSGGGALRAIALDHSSERHMQPSPLWRRDTAPVELRKRERTGAAGVKVPKRGERKGDWDFSRARTPTKAHACSSWQGNTADDTAGGARPTSCSRDGFAAKPMPSFHTWRAAHRRTPAAVLGSVLCCGLRTDAAATAAWAPRRTLAGMAAAVAAAATGLRRLKLPARTPLRGLTGAQHARLHSGRQGGGRGTVAKGGVGIAAAQAMEAISKAWTHLCAPR